MKVVEKKNGCFEGSGFGMFFGGSGGFFGRFFGGSGGSKHKQKTIRDSLTHELKFGSNPKYIVSNWMYIFFEKRMYHI